MKRIRIPSILILLFLMLGSTPLLAADTRVQGGSLTKIKHVPGNYFIFLIVTNAPPPNGTNYIAQLSDVIDSISTNFTSIATTGMISAASISYPWTTWDGPTNTISMLGTNHYWYTALTPCAVTDFVYDAAVVNYAVLTILNYSGSNITFTSFAPGPQEDTSHTYTLTNGFILKSWMEYSHGISSQVTRMFGP